MSKAQRLENAIMALGPTKDYRCDLYTFIETIAKAIDIRPVVDTYKDNGTWFIGVRFTDGSFCRFES